MYLYIDTTEKLIIGLIDSNFQWIDYFEEDIRSASSKIQSLILEHLEKINKKITDITCVFQASGPGSYTGMRVSEGLCQILEWHNIDVFSFYHFEVPVIYGIDEGRWSANAYKGDIFIHDWAKGKEDDYKLIRIEDVEQVKVDEIFTHFYKEPFEAVLKGRLTSELIRKNPEILFNYLIKNKIRREPYYYRPIEIEFTKPKKGKK